MTVFCTEAMGVGGGEHSVQVILACRHYMVSITIHSNNFDLFKYGESILYGTKSVLGRVYNIHSSNENICFWS